MNWLKELWKAKVFRPLFSSLSPSLLTKPFSCSLILAQEKAAHTKWLQQKQFSWGGGGGRDAAATQSTPRRPALHGHPQGGYPNKLARHLGSTPHTQTAACRDKAWRNAHLHSSPPQPLGSEMSTPLGTCKSSPHESRLVHSEIFSLFFLFLLN